MNYNDDNPGPLKDRVSGTDRFVSPPNPLFAAEPPVVPNVPETSQHAQATPSWRHLVDASRATPSDHTSGFAAGDEIAEARFFERQDRSPGELGSPTESTSGVDGRSVDRTSIGQLPGAEAATAPGDGSAAAARRQPSVTLGRIGEELFAWLKTLASAAVYATLIVTFGFQVARVEGQSMAPTLENQDRLIVNKLAYRLGDPQVGDIVMLYYPVNPDKSFVKRVIAEEGNTIRIVDGRVYRNDVLINDDYVPPEFRSHDDWGPEVVPQGYYFVMGDHRNNSSDSRHWRFVPKKYIIGKVQLRWWPLPQARLF